MEKWMCFAAIGVGAIMALIFLVDMVAGFPFGGSPFIVVDIFGLIGAVIVAYLGYNALKEVK